MTFNFTNISRSIILVFFALVFVFFPQTSFAAEPKLNINFTEGIVGIPGYTFTAKFGNSVDGLGSRYLWYRYRWYQGQSWSPWTRKTKASHRYSWTGEKTFHLEAKNSLGQVISTSARLVVKEKRMPNGVFDVSPKVGTTSTPFKFTPLAWDNISSPRDSFLIKFDFDGDGTWDTKWKKPHTFEKVFSDIGSFSPKMIIKNRVGATRYLPSYRTKNSKVGRIQVSSDLRPKPFFNVAGPIVRRDIVYKFDATDSLPYLYVSKLKYNLSAYYFKWDFDGDGKYDTSWSPSPIVYHTFEKGNKQYTTTLNVKNQYGEQRFSKTFRVAKLPKLPTAKFKISPKTGGTNRDYVFNASSSKDKGKTGSLEYAWDFGADGFVDTDFSLKNKIYLYTFKNTGKRSIRLVVRDSLGRVISTTKTLLVNKDSQSNIAGEYTKTSPEHWSSTYIKHLRENGYTNKESLEEFDPNRLITRAELIKMLFEGTRNDRQAATTVMFTDVSRNDWFYESVAGSLELGWLKKRAKFYPESSATLEEVIKLSFLAHSISTDQTTNRTFLDVPSDSWFASYASTSAKARVVEKFPNNNFKPGRKVTRAEAAKIIYRTAVLSKQHIRTDKIARF